MLTHNSNLLKKKKPTSNFAYLAQITVRYILTTPIIHWINWDNTMTAL